MNNLDFSDRYDIERFKRKCRDQRMIAERWPAYDPQMAKIAEYQWQMGPWHLIFMLEVWEKPMWHGSAAVLEEIGYVTLREASEAKFRKVEIPQDALLAVKSWEPEHYQQARFMLAEVFGPILRPGDDHQPAREDRGKWALHWLIPYEGERFWLKEQH